MFRFQQLIADLHAHFCRLHFLRDDECQRRQPQFTPFNIHYLSLRFALTLLRDRPPALGRSESAAEAIRPYPRAKPRWPFGP